VECVILIRLLFTVLSVIFSANGWDFVDRSSHLETVHTANSFRIWLCKWKS